MKKRIISLLTILVMAFCMSAVTYAEVPTVSLEQPEFEESEIQPYYTYAKECTAVLQIASDTAYCDVSVTGSTSVTKIEITMTLQKKTLWWWGDKEEWTTTVSSTMAGITKTASVSSGTYRVKGVCKIYSGSSSESVTIYSAEVSA